MAVVMEKPRTGDGRIRITYVISAINTEQAGTEGHLLRLIRGLDRTRFAPSLVVMQRSDWTEQFDDPQVPLHVLDFKSFQRPSDWNVVAKLTEFFRQNGTQIAELHFIDAHFAGSMAAKRARVPVVISCRRDLGHQYGLKGLWLMKLGNRHITRFLANAHFVAKAMARLEGIDSSRFEVIHNGIDLAAFDAAKDIAVPTEFASRIAGKRVVSFAANLRPVKNPNMFVDAAALLANRYPDVAFAIMGEGELRGELERKVDRLGLSERVLFLGSVPGIAPYLRQSHVACLSSHSEGFSNSVVEYMAAGLPVVVPDVGGLAEAVQDGVTGYVVPPDSVNALGDGLSRILDLDEPQRLRMGELGRQRVEQNFTMERQLIAHQDTYVRELQMVTS